jgi:hypothetical protein
MSPADIKGQKPGGNGSRCFFGNATIRVSLRAHGLGYRFFDDQSLRELFGMLDDFAPGFEIVEPRKAGVQ